MHGKEASEMCDFSCIGIIGLIQESNGSMCNLQPPTLNSAVGCKVVSLSSVSAISFYLPLLNKFALPSFIITSLTNFVLNFL